MPIVGWIIFGIIAIGIGGFANMIATDAHKVETKIVTVLVAAMILFALLCGMMWYYNNTASGQRQMIDQKSNFSGGLNRTVKVYTANGDIIAEYTGLIDIEANDGGYIKFDFEGKRYMYYNCFVESIANIE